MKNLVVQLAVSSTAVRAIAVRGDGDIDFPLDPITLFGAIKSYFWPGEEELDKQSSKATAFEQREEVRLNTILTSFLQNHCFYLSTL